MIRAILIFILLIVVYQAVRSVIRSAISSAGPSDGPRKLPGGDMVLDPQCRTYVVKDRAVTRRIDGAVMHFCSQACAEEHERRARR